MNRLMKEYFHFFEMYQALRNQLMSVLTDADLAFQVSENNPTLGALCREIGEVEASYLESFKSFKQSFAYRNETPGLDSSVVALTKWYTELDQDLKITLEALTDDDLDNRVINRGPDFNLPPQIQLEVYKEALLIFYGKVDVYLKAMGKERPEQWQEWIG